MVIKGFKYGSRDGHMDRWTNGRTKGKINSTVQTGRESKNEKRPSLPLGDEVHEYRNKQLFCFLIKNN